MYKYLDVPLRFTPGRAAAASPPFGPGLPVRQAGFPLLSLTHLHHPSIESTIASKTLLSLEKVFSLLQSQTKERKIVPNGILQVHRTQIVREFFDGFPIRLFTTYEAESAGR